MTHESKPFTRDWDALFARRDEFNRWYKESAYLLDSAAMLLGDEMHTVHFDWDRAVVDGELDDRFKVALVEVNPSPFASCTTAIRLFYQQLHEHDPNWVVERAFSPVSENNRLMMEEAGVVPVSVEGKMPIASFDVLCFSQQMIGDEVSLLYLLERSGIPLKSKDRTAADPLIIRGGSSSYNPSLIMDVCDLFFIGEGEDYMPDLLTLVEQRLRQGYGKEDILLEAINTWDCLWAPCFYEQRFDDKGDLIGLFPVRGDVVSRISSHHVADLDACFVCTKPLASYCFHSSAYDGFELTRGCDGQCSFCVSGFTTLPFRARSPKRTLEALRQRAYHTGDELISLTSFSSTTYPYLNRLMCDLFGEMSLRYNSFSQRIDTFGENPEFCHFLPRVGSRHAVFGVEGVSQRLRQAVSKNCTEDDILDVVRLVCRAHYQNCKFMFIGGLPGETAEDWEELVSLAKKIRQIADEEEEAGNARPTFLFSWTPLRVFPLTPYQWLETRVGDLEPPQELVERLESEGVVVSRDRATTPLSDVTITQMLLRGDSRLQDLLIEMARHGLLRFGVFSDEALAFVDGYLAEHDVPGYAYWFAERGPDAVFPWDFLDYGPTKEHLRRRYDRSLSPDPCDFPRCMEGCQGCGTCTPSELKTMSNYREEHKKDVRISLAHLGIQDGSVSHDLRRVRDEDKHLHFAVLSFSHDVEHRMVHRNYWENELARALNYAGIGYVRGRLWVNKPYLERLDWAVGDNAAVVGFTERHEEKELLDRIGAHTVNMRVKAVTWYDHMPRLRAIAYRIPLTSDVSEHDVRMAAETALGKTEWVVEVEKRLADRTRTVTRDVRPWLFALSVSEGSILMEADPRLAPYTVFCNLCGIGWEEAGRTLPVRDRMLFE